MAGVTRLVVKDSGALNILANLRMEITGGIHEEEGSEEHQDGPLTVVEVAAINEFGAGKIPPRPWLRGWADNSPAKRIVAAIRRVLKDMAVKQEFPPEPMQEVTQQVLTSIASQFLDGKLQPNAKMTLENKKPETRPLIETRQLVDALRAKLFASIPGWDFEAYAPTVTGPKFRKPRKPRGPRKYGPRKPRQFGPKKPRWLQAKGP